MKTPLTLSLLLSLTINAIAQKPQNCAALLKRDIARDAPEKATKVISSSACFGLDSIDVLVFGNGPVLGTLMVKMATKHKIVTYGDLLAEINKEKSDISYTSLRALIITQHKLEATKATAETWDSSVPLLKLIGTPDSELQNLHDLMMQHLSIHLNYRQLIVYYKMKQEENKEKAAKP